MNTPITAEHCLRNQMSKTKTTKKFNVMVDHFTKLLTYKPSKEAETNRSGMIKDTSTSLSHLPQSPRNADQNGNTSV